MSEVMQQGPAAVGVFDSGLGGLSVLHHIRAELPAHALLYFADSAYAPYGPKSEAEIIARSLTIVDFLLAQGAQALVVACNTATVAAIKAIRQAHPHLPVVGVEPGLKPAAAASHSKKVGVLATAATLAGEKFKLLQQQVAQFYQVEFFLQAGHGLVELVEQGELDSPRLRQLLHAWLAPMAAQGVDTLVLGCTHYPFLRPALGQVMDAAGWQMQMVDTGAAIARQLQRVLQQHGLDAQTALPAATLRGYTSGAKGHLQEALQTLLGWQAQVEAARI
ncbi:glutamate racemase [Massilia sp. W12]|uniref:glutamate racemase n=1 Tax=Massilia sp. W12 TaxID=3126507 RepID=UPI0030D44841